MNNYILFAFLIFAVYNMVSLYLINSRLKFICKLIERITKPPKPGIITFLTSEKENGMLKFVLSLPQAGAADVVSRKLTVKIGESELVALELAADALESQEFVCADNTVVVGSLVDVDDAGNESPASEFSFVIVDTIAPPQPGEVGVKVTGEFDAVEPEPQPEPEADAQDEEIV